MNRVDVEASALHTKVPVASRLANVETYRWTPSQYKRTD